MPFQYDEKCSSRVLDGIYTGEFPFLPAWPSWLTGRINKREKKPWDSLHWISKVNDEEGVRCFFRKKEEEAEKHKNRPIALKIKEAADAAKTEDEIYKEFLLKDSRKINTAFFFKHSDELREHTLIESAVTLQLRAEALGLASPTPAPAPALKAQAPALASPAPEPALDTSNLEALKAQASAHFTLNNQTHQLSSASAYDLWRMSAKNASPTSVGSPIKTEAPSLGFKFGEAATNSSPAPAPAFSFKPQAPPLAAPTTGFSFGTPAANDDDDAMEVDD